MCRTHTDYSSWWKNPVLNLSWRLIDYFGDFQHYFTHIAATSATIRAFPEFLCAIFFSKPLAAVPHNPCATVMNPVAITIINPRKEIRLAEYRTRACFLDFSRHYCRKFLSKSLTTFLACTHEVTSKKSATLYAVPLLQILKARNQPWIFLMLFLCLWYPVG